MFARHSILDDGLLHGPAVGIRRFGTKAFIAEPAFQLLPASWRHRHQPQAGSVHAVSLRRRTSRPACGNWWRTQGGITELPPATESHATA